LSAGKGFCSKMKVKETSGGGKKCIKSMILYTVFASPQKLMPLGLTNILQGMCQPSGMIKNVAGYSLLGNGAGLRPLRSVRLRPDSRSVRQGALEERPSALRQRKLKNRYSLHVTRYWGTDRPCGA